MPKDVNAIGSTNANKVFDLPLHLQPGQVNTLSFSQDSIASMHLTPGHDLEISFRDGSKIVVADFDELANSAMSCGRDTLIQLSDNTIIYPDQLRDQLVQQGGVDFTAHENGVITLNEPKAGQILTHNIDSGSEYKLGFTLDGVNAAQSGHNLLLTFKDGGVLVLNNYFTAVDSDLPPAMTLADGATIDANALLTSCKLVEIPNAAEAILADASPMTNLQQSVPNVEPAAGETPAKAEVVHAKVDNAASVANIEPAAGDAGNALPGSSRGYGFGSSIDRAGFSGENATGPIGATALNYQAPEIKPIPYLSGFEGTPSHVDSIPLLTPAVSNEDESDIGSVSGKVNVDYGNSKAGELTFNDSFTSAYALTSHGVPVVVSHTGNTYTGVAGGQTVFTLVLDPDTGEYTFTQLKEIDHANATDPNDFVGLVFGVTATDGDGDTATTTITVNVYDDGPVAVDDGAFVGNSGLTVSGNVLTNDDAGADGLGSVTKVTFNGVDYSVPAVGTVTVVGDYGTLKLAADGTYTYTSSNTALGTDKFTYTMVDYDGDPSSAVLSVEVQDIDYKPCVKSAESTIDETNIVPDGTESVSGKVQANFFGDGPGTINPVDGSFSAGGSLKGDALTSNGVPVVVALAGDVYTGTANGKVVFTLTLNDDGSYKYTQVGQLDHADGTNPNDVITLNFGFVATDADGDTANGTITVKVLDDAPTATNDVATLASAPGSVSGNVTDNDNVGEDKPGYVVKEISFEGNTVAVPATGTVTIAGAHGNLTISSTGAYTYTGASVGDDKFIYKIVDQDGDVATANLTVTVNDIDVCPIVANAQSVIDETNIVPDGTESVSGKVIVDFGVDGPGKVDATGSFSSGGSLKGGALTSNGVPVVVALAGDVYTGTANGKVVFTLTLNDDGSYKYTQVGQLDHADGTNPNDVITLNFGFVATDADGDTANGTITVKVLDDAPVAQDDLLVAVSHDQVVTGNVIDNDYVGNDVEGTIIKISYEGKEYNVAPGVQTTIVTDCGELKIAADGSYTYVANKEAGPDSVTSHTFTADDVAGTSSSITHDGVTISASVDRDLVWVNEGFGSGIGIAGGKYGTGKVYGADEGLIVSSTNLASSMTFGIGDIGANNVGQTFSYDVYVEGSATPVRETVVLSADKITNGVFTLTVDEGALISKVVLIGGPGGELSFVLTSLEVVTPTEGVCECDDDFIYTLMDKDGDVSTAHLNIKVECPDYTPIPSNSFAQIDETNIVPDGTESVSGKVVVDFQGDGPGTINPVNGSFSAGGSLKDGALTSNGVPVVVALAGDVYTGTANGKVVFTLTLNDDGSYKYTQVGQLDHADGTNPNDVITLNFGFVATDADGDTANGTITVKVLDDAPLAANDGTYNVSSVVNGNVLTNDYKGEDLSVPVVKISYKGTDYAVPASGTTTVTGDHGVLVIKADGTYTYTPTSAGSDDFTYTIRDNDGDTSSAHLVLKVQDNVCVDVNVAPDCVCVKEDGTVDVPLTANVTGGSGNETLTLTLTGVDASWAFSASGWTKNADGSYSITLPQGQTTYDGKFTFAPPANSDVDLSGLKVTAGVYDPDLSVTKTDSDSFAVHVDAVADAPTLNVTLPQGDNTRPNTWTFSNYYNYLYWGQGYSKEFTIQASVSDKDGSEKISYFIIEVPKTLADFGVGFSAGTEISHGVWKVMAGDEVGLKMTFPEIDKVDGAWWKNPDYIIPQGIHNFTVTVVNTESNLSGEECDYTDNTNSAKACVQVVIFSSPLVLDLNGDGLNLTTADNGVYFDINGDGVTDKTGWVSAEDGLLTLDKNHNGLIDGQSELFGGATVDGFTVLAQYDENSDGVIDSKDSVWKDLTVWQDLNQDGVTQNGELTSLESRGFTSISLDATATDYMVAGNGVSAESTVTGADGQETLIADAWFAFYNGTDDLQMAAARANEADVSLQSDAQETVAANSMADPIVINNFDVSEDTIDLSSLVDTSACDVTAAICDFVFSRTENGNTVISVDASGSGSASAAVDVVVLQGVSVNNVDDFVQIAQQQQAQSGLGTV